MTDPEQLRVVSYGGGVQSTALLVLAAQGYVDFPTFLFCNVGDDSEHPDTLAYVREVAFDYAAQHGIRMEELHRVPRKGVHAGKPETLYGRLMRDGSRSLPIPVRMAGGAPGTRSCTADFKIRVVQRWVLAHGATEANPCTTAIGISTDEYQRATSRIKETYERLEYPLLTLEWRGRVGLSRSDCMDVIRSAGLPMPRKSSCYFCPFHTAGVWAEMRRDEPDLFAKSADLEDTLNARRAQLACPRGGQPASRPVGHEWDDDDDVENLATEPVPPGERVRCCGEDRTVLPDGTMPAHHKNPVYLTRFGKPLREAIAAAQDGLFGAGWDADEGYRCGDVCDT